MLIVIQRFKKKKQWAGLARLFPAGLSELEGDNLVGVIVVRKFTYF